MAAVTKMERPILDVNQLGDLADYGLAGVTPEAVSAEYWDMRFPVIEGGLFDGLDISDLDEYTIEKKPWYKGTVDGVAGFLRGIHLPKWERKQRTVKTMLGIPEQPVVAESEEAGRNRFFGWLGEQKRRFDEWRKQPVFGEREEVAPVSAAVAPAAPEGESERFGWLKNGWKYLSGLPGGIVGRFRRQPEAGATPQISRAERIKAIQEGTRQFVEQHKLDLALGLLGVSAAGIGATVVSPENIGVVNSFMMEISAMGVSAISLLGVMIGDKRGPEFIPAAEKAYQRPIRAIQRLCSQRSVRAGLELAGVFSTGFAAGGLGRMVVDSLQMIQQGVSAGAPAPAEMATGSLKNVWSPGVGAASEVTDWEARRQAIGQLVQPIVSTVPPEASADLISQSVGQAVTGYNQALEIVRAIKPDLAANPQVQPVVEAANNASRALADYYNQASTGGFDATEAAKLKELASQVQHAANKALEAARVVAQQNAQTAAGAADAEAVRQGILQGGQVMKDVIAATPSQTAFEALQQQVFQATGSPHSAEAANALSWSLPHGDITGLHTEAIGEAAKKVTDLISQAHDYAAGHGVSYTIHSIRQAVDAGQLTPDVLKAVEAANAPAGSDVKTVAQTGLNTILQTVVK